MEQPMQTNQDVRDELMAICNSLGKLDENDGTYMKDRDCKACLKEISRFLNSDTKLRIARVTLGEINVIKSDLIYLLVQYCDYHDGDSDLFDLIIRICANLTASAILLFENQELPTDPEDFKLYNKLLNCLYGYKAAFAENELVWTLLNTYLKKLQEKEDDLVFERLIVLIRNILHIPVDSTADMGNHCDFDAHEMCLYRMDKSGMLDTLLHIAAETKKGTEYCFHLTEIFYLMLRDQNPESIAKSRPYTLKRKLEDDDPDKRRLAELSARDRRDREANKLDMQQMRFRNTMFSAVNYRSLSERPMMMKKPLSSLETMRFDDGKTQLKKARNRKPLSSETSMLISDTNKSSAKIAYSLKLFCQRFVEEVYSNYMQQIKHNLIQKKTQDNDESYYLWAIQFFTAFNLHMNLPLENISETLSSSTLHYIQILITTYQEKLKIEKKKFQDISKRLHLALRAYREIISLIKSIEPNTEYYNTAENMKRNIFTETEYSTLLLTLFQSYEEPKHSSHYLIDLILTNDTFLGLLEDYARTHSAVEIEEAIAEDELEDPLDPEEAAQQANNEESAIKKPLKKKSKKKSKQSIEFKTAHFAARYCIPNVISSYLSVLKSFKTNDTKVNLAILGLFERIVNECKNPVILLQASLLKCLLDIMAYHSEMPGKDRFDSLTQHLVQTFGAMANKRRWMYQELLFWKTGSDVIEIENAIDPLAPVLPEHRDIEDDEELGAAQAAEPSTEPSTQTQRNEQLEADSLAQLRAELYDSSDEESNEGSANRNAEASENSKDDSRKSDNDIDKNVDEINCGNESEQNGNNTAKERIISSESQSSDESVADLLATLDDGPESDFVDEVLPELSDDDSVHNYNTSGNKHEVLDSD